MLVDRLDSSKLPGQLVHAEVNLAKSSFTEDFTYSVEVYICLRGLTTLLEGKFDMLCQFSVLFRARRHIRIAHC